MADSQPAEELPEETEEISAPAESWIPQEGGSGSNMRYLVWVKHEVPPKVVPNSGLVVNRRTRHKTRTGEPLSLKPWNPGTLKS